MDSHETCTDEEGDCRLKLNAGDKLFVLHATSAAFDAIGQLSIVIYT